MTETERKNYRAIDIYWDRNLCSLLIFDQLLNFFIHNLFRPLIIFRIILNCFFFIYSTNSTGFFNWLKITGQFDVEFELDFQTIIVIIIYSWFHLYGYCLYISPLLFSPFILSSFSPYFQLPLSFTFFPPEVAPVRMWPQPFSLMLYRICTRAEENCAKPVPIQSII